MAADIENAWKVSPAAGGLCLTSMLGFVLSAYFVYPVSINFGIASMLVFVLMFIASLTNPHRDY